MLRCVSLVLTLTFGGVMPALTISITCNNTSTRYLCTHVNTAGGQEMSVHG